MCGEAREAGLYGFPSRSAWSGRAVAMKSLPSPSPLLFPFPIFFNPSVVGAMAAPSASAMVSGAQRLPPAFPVVTTGCCLNCAGFTRESEQVLHSLQIYLPVTQLPRCATCTTRGRRSRPHGNCAVHRGAADVTPLCSTAGSSFARPHSPRPLQIQPLNTPSPFTFWVPPTHSSYVRGRLPSFHRFVT